MSDYAFPFTRDMMKCTNCGRCKVDLPMGYFELPAGEVILVPESDEYSDLEIAEYLKQAVFDCPNGALAIKQFSN